MFGTSYLFTKERLFLVVPQSSSQPHDNIFAMLWARGFRRELINDFILQRNISLCGIIFIEPLKHTIVQDCVDFESCAVNLIVLALLVLESRTGIGNTVWSRSQEHDTIELWNKKKNKHYVEELTKNRAFYMYWIHGVQCWGVQNSINSGLVSRDSFVNFWRGFLFTLFVLKFWV